MGVIVDGMYEPLDRDEPAVKPPRFDWLRTWWSLRQERKRCLHHDPGGNPANTRPAVSWIEQTLVDLGRAKLLMCTHCRKVWIV